MKLNRLISIIFVVCLFLFMSNTSDTRKTHNSDNIINDTIMVSDLQTTFIIFEHTKVLWVNIGNPKDFAVNIQNNTVLITALSNKSFFTNYMIELENNNFLTGMIIYERNVINPIKKYNFNIKYETSLDSADICNYNIKYRNEDLQDLGVFKDRILLQLVNLYMDDNFIYYRLKMNNDSKIKYDIDNIKIYVKDYRTNILKEEIEGISYDKKMITNKVEYIHICSKLVPISSKDIIYVEIREKNGFRNFGLVLNLDVLSNSKKIKDIK